MPALDPLVGLGSPGETTWTVREGDNCSLDFAVRVSGSYLNITGVTGTCSIRSDYDSTTDIVTGTVTFPTPASGTVKVTLTAANTTALATAVTGLPASQRLVPAGYFDIELQDGTNQVTICCGQVMLSREITP